MKYISICCFRLRLEMILSIIIALLLGLITSLSSANATSIDEVRIGIFNNKPMCYFDDTGKPAGIFVSVIEYVATQENWKLTFIEDSFSSLRVKLEKGEIDLLLSTAVSEERKKLYTYNGIDVFSNWAEVYVSPASDINTLLDLKGKRIATLKKGIYSTGPEGIVKLCDNFRLNCEFHFVDDYKAALIAVRDGQADAGVVNRLVGAVYENELGLKKSGIVFSPVHIRYALNKVSPNTPLIVEALDQHLAVLKQDNNSIYHHAINEALGGSPARIISRYIRFILLASGVLIVISFIFLFFLRRQVKNKTMDLSRVNTELSQRKSEFEAIFNAITDGVVFVDQERRVVMINPGFTKMLGYKPEEILGQSAQIVYANPEDFTDQGRVRYSKEVKINKPIYESEYRRKDGSVFPAETLGAQVVDSKGAIIGFLGILRDITERKQADEELLRSEERYRRLTENASDMIYRMSLPDGKYEYVSPAAKTIFGYSPKEFYDTPILIKEAIHPAWVDYFAEQWKLLIAGDMPPTYEYQIINKSGEERWLNQRNVLIKNDSGQSIAIEGIVTDITERKKAEEEKAILENKLQQAYKMDAIGTLAGGIAHDFNNILSIIIGYAELIKKDSSNESNVQQHIKEVQVAADRAKNLVKQILAFSRKEKTELIPIPPQSLIKETLKLLRSTTPTTVSIIHEISQDCGMIMADPTQLHQLLMNLFTNAMHAIDEKGEVTVNLQEVNLIAEALIHKPELLPGRYACLSVSDTGAGMDQEMINHIFVPFYTTKEVGKGTGMGLSVVHGIVESHGGFITVESELGRGSTFDVFFPVTVEEMEEILEIETTHSLEGTERVLLVDDEIMILEMAEKMLKNFGYEVVAESSSVKALEILKSNPDGFDLLITDQSMPNMSGSELVAEILKAKPGMPIILCTGYSTKVSAENASEKGISKYMTKPYSLKDLAKAIREVLKGQF